MKKAIVLISLIFFTFVFSGCSGGIDTKEAKAHINSFLEAVEAEDYELASTFLHPERPTDLETFFKGVEDTAGLDFSSGIEISRYTNFSYSYYDSTVDGSAYTLAMKVKVGDEDIKMEIEIVSNDNGYGIYNLDIDTND